jgi:hypothetical protein
MWFEQAALIHEKVSDLSRDPYKSVFMPSKYPDLESTLIHWCANNVFKIKVDTLTQGDAIEIAFNGRILESA